ncbi:MAG: hypothetical protein WBH47_15440 [Streptosporangiaceae bacterium]
MRRILPIVAAAGAVLAAGCGGSRSTYYVGTNGTAVALITWSAPQSGRASGTITAATLSGTAPTQKVNAQTVPVTVRLNGSDVSFNGSRLAALAGPMVTGTMRGGRLTITAPDASGYLESAVLRSATSAVYGSDLAKLRQRVSRDNTAAKRTQSPTPTPTHQQLAGQVTTDQQQVASDVSSLQTDTSAVSSDLTQMDTDVQQTSTDLAQLNSDAAGGQGPSCENVATVDDDATTVDDDGSTVGDDSSTITADVGTVQSDISQLTGDLATLHKDGGSPVGDPSPQTVISQAQAAISNAVSQANSYIGTVNGYLKQAYTTANNLAGSNCGGSG